MNAELMRVAGGWLQCQPGERVRQTMRSPQHLPYRRRRLPVRVGFHPPAAGFVLAAERELDAPLVGLWPTFHHRPISLADVTGLEQPSQFGQRLAMAPEHQATGGVAIEPVGKRGRARQAKAQRVEIILQALAAFWTP